MAENDNEYPPGEVHDIPINQLIMNPALYPRAQVNKRWVEDLRPSCQSHPAILIARSGDTRVDKNVIDGWDRTLARIAEGLKTVPGIFIDVKSEEEFLELAISANGKHGRRYTHKECCDNARRLFAMGRSPAEIATKLGTSPRSVRRWLKPLQDKSRAEIDARIRELREKGMGFKEIADILDLKTHPTTVARRQRRRAAKRTVGQNAGTSAEPAGGEVPSAPAAVDKDQRNASVANDNRGDVGMAEEQQPGAAAPAVRAAEATVPLNTSNMAEVETASMGVQQVIRAIRTVRLLVHRLKKGVPCFPFDNPKLMDELGGLYDSLGEVVANATGRDGAGDGAEDDSDISRSEGGDHDGT